ncbi:MAG: L-threonylcarbamoyladenylate synthase [Candidatus Moraniibacteriota bacterium]
MKKNDLAKKFLAGQIGVLATDTLYGVLGSALRKETVERIYGLRQRDLQKPMIILISSIADLELFEIKLSDLQKKKLQELWPAPVSVILQCENEKFAYLHRGVGSLAFRLPANVQLQKILKISGPLVAPSANLSGQPPAQTIAQAQTYFGDQVDFYLDAGFLQSEPSTLVRLLENGQVEILREGKGRM